MISCDFIAAPQNLMEATTGSYVHLIGALAKEEKEVKETGWDVTTTKKSCLHFLFD